jgi:hypothetical protein
LQSVKLCLRGPSRQILSQHAFYFVTGLFALRQAGISTSVVNARAEPLK